MLRVYLWRFRDLVPGVLGSRVHRLELRGPGCGVGVVELGLETTYKALARNDRMDARKTHEGSLIGTVIGDC